MAIAAGDFVGWDFGWMEENKKSGGGFFFGGADFFFAKRLFFRYGEGCEGRASRATVGVTAKDNGGACSR